MDKRIRHIGIARGIAVFSIVAGHLKFEGSFGYDPIQRLVFQYHVPVLFLISGYLFSPDSNSLRFIKRKARRLLLPYWHACFIMLVVLVFFRAFYGRTTPPSLFNSIREFFLAACYGAGSNAGLIMPADIVPIGAIWYLEALLVALVEVNLVLKLRHCRMVTVLLLAVVSYITGHFFLLPFNLQPGLLAGLYVYVGYIANQKKLFADPMSNGLTAICIGISCVAYIFDINVSITRLYLGPWLLGLPVSFTTSALCIDLARRISTNAFPIVDTLDFIGKNSLPFFVFHLLLLNLGFKWMLVQLTHVSSTNLLFAINLILQLGLSSLYVLLCRHDPLLRLVYAIKPRKDQRGKRQ